MPHESAMLVWQESASGGKGCIAGRRTTQLLHLHNKPPRTWAFVTVGSKGAGVHLSSTTYLN